MSKSHYHNIFQIINYRWVFYKFIRKMKPIALLIFYQPSHVFKNRKYFLREGTNIVGSDRSCEICIQGSQLPPKTAAFKIYNNLLTLQRISKQCKIEVMSNLSEKKKCFIENDVEYILTAEKQFKIGQWKGIFKGLQQNQYELMKNIININSFNNQFQVTEKYDSEQNSLLQIKDSKTPIIQSEEYQATLPLEDNNNQCATLPLNDNDECATLPLNDNNQGATLLLDHNDEKMQQEQPQNNKKDQIPNPPELIRQTNSVILQNQQSQNNSSVDMPRTLQEDQQIEYQNDNSKVMTQQKKMPFQKHIQTNPMNKTQPLPLIPKGSFNQNANELKKCKSQLPAIQKDQLFDLFESNDIKSQVVQHKVIKQQTRMVRKLLMSSIDEISSNSNKVNQTRKSEPIAKTQKKISFSGFKPSQMQKLIAKKMNLKIIQSQDEDYDILIVPSQLRVTLRLIKALILGKDIYSQSYINNGSGKIFSKIFGQPWNVIYAKKGNTTFLDEQLFFLSEHLLEYGEIIQLAGGKLYPTISKNLSKLNLNVILTENDGEIYQYYGHYKKWKFYDEKTMQQCLCLAEWAPKNSLKKQFFK